MAYTVTTHTTDYRWDDDEYGDPYDSPTELGTDTDEYDVSRDEWDDQGETPVTKAIELIKRNLGPVEPSSWPGFRTEVWYSAIDSYEHPYTGVIEEVTAHLDGFSPSEQREVFDALVRKA